jgi:hypothetical protein
MTGRGRRASGRTGRRRDRPEQVKEQRIRLNRRWQQQRAEQDGLAFFGVREDRAAMTIERSHFIQPDYRHVALDMLLQTWSPSRESRPTRIVAHVLSLPPVTRLGRRFGYQR